MEQSRRSTAFVFVANGSWFRSHILVSPMSSIHNVCDNSNPPPSVSLRHTHDASSCCLATCTFAPKGFTTSNRFQTRPAPFSSSTFRSSPLLSPSLPTSFSRSTTAATRMATSTTPDFKSDQQAIAAACKLFRETFNTHPTEAGAAPGRVNLIGEHVDYNDGFVFPFALEKNTYIVAKPTEDETIQVISSAYPQQPVKFDIYDTPLPSEVPKWASYMKGIVAIYRRNGYELKNGFQAAVVSSVPQGGGLSSSAALEMSTAIILESLLKLQGKVTSEDRAKMGQKCEHEFANVPCGIMDQLISSKAQQGKALLIDCRSLEIELIPLYHPDISIVIANSKVTHQLSGSEYPLRRKQCFEMSDTMKSIFPDKNITHLRDCTEEMLNKTIEMKLNSEESINRAKHVISEDQRTLQAANALKSGDLNLVGQLMYQSHQSLRDLYQVSTKEIDCLVDIAMSVDGVYGSRITGGGFGGCTVTLVRKDSVQNLIQQIHEKYPKANNGIHAEVFATNAGTGARDLTHLVT